MTTVEELGRRAKQASRQMNRMGTKQKNQILALAAQALVDEQEEILKANAMDIEAARKKNMPEPMVDRLVLSESRIAGMAEGLTQLIALEDPIGEIISSTVRPNGLEICKKRAKRNGIPDIHQQISPHRQIRKPFNRYLCCFAHSLSLHIIFFYTVLYLLYQSPGIKKSPFFCK